MLLPFVGSGWSAAGIEDEFSSTLHGRIAESVHSDDETGVL